MLSLKNRMSDICHITNKFYVGKFDLTERRNVSPSRYGDVVSSHLLLLQEHARPLPAVTKNDEERDG